MLRILREWRLYEKRKISPHFPRIWQGGSQGVVPRGSRPRALPAPRVPWEPWLHRDGRTERLALGHPLSPAEAPATPTFGSVLAAWVAFWLPICVSPGLRRNLLFWGQRADRRESPAGADVWAFRGSLSACRWKEQASLSTDHLSLLFPYLLSANRNRIEANGAN